jgi:5'-nucleotidase (lipoprotein e(P4) family)
MKMLMLPIISFLLVSCASQKPVANQDHMLLAVDWFQRAGEVKALQYQAYNAAKVELKKILRKKSRKPRAIIVDVDETVLDNSPYQAKNVLKNEHYPQGWKEWVNMAKAEAIPGSVEFLNYAAKRGVVTFYVTNRKAYALDATYKNLKLRGFPVKKERILLRTKSSSKEARRQKILKKYNVVMLAGDNLGDFAPEFDHKVYQKRNAQADKEKKMFGHRYIVLPNPMYGAWEGALDKGYWGKSAKEKDAVRRAVLHGM